MIRVQWPLEIGMSLSMHRMCLAALFAVLTCAQTTSLAEIPHRGESSIDQPQLSGGRVDAAPVQAAKGGQNRDVYKGATAESFSLVAGKSIESQVRGWATRAGWHLIWNLPDDWIAPGDRAYGTNFEQAVRHVIEELAGNGAGVVGDIWRGNKTVVVSSVGAT